MATERLIIEISERGALVVKRNVADIGKGAEQASKGVNLLKGALLGLVSLQIIRGLFSLADAFTTIQNRLRIVTKSQEELNTVTEELFNIANRTRSSVEATAELYSKLAKNADQLGLSQEQLLLITERVNQATIVSGASTQEASAGIRQLGQAFSKGKLNGDELVSLLENLPVVVDIITDSLDINRKEFLKLAGEGKISAGIIANAFLQAESVSTKFGKTISTLGQAFTTLRNNLIKFVGEVDQSTGITRFLAQNIVDISNNLKELGIVIRVTFGEISKFVDPANIGVGVFRATVIATVKDLTIVGAALLRTLATVVDGATGFVFAIRKTLTLIIEFIVLAFRRLIEVIETAVNGIISGINKIPGVDVAKVDIIGDVEFLAKAGELGTTFGKEFVAGIQKTTVTDLFDKILSQIEKETAAAAVTRPKATTAPGAAALVTDEDLLKFEKLIGLLRQENELLKLNNAERQNQETILEFEAKLKRDLTDSEEALVREQLKLNRELTVFAELTEAARTPQETFNQQLAALNSLVEQGTIDFVQYLVAVDAATKQLDESAKKTGQVVEDVFTTTFRGAQGALEEFVRTGKASFREFASSVLADLARIASQQLFLNALGAVGLGKPPGAQFGGSFTVGGTGGPDSQPVAFRATPGEQVTVTPPGQVAAGGITIVNILDPNEIPEAMAGRQGEQVILNHISRNRTSIRQAIA